MTTNHTITSIHPWQRPATDEEMRSAIAQGIAAYGNCGPYCTGDCQVDGTGQACPDVYQVQAETTEGEGHPMTTTDAPAFHNLSTEALTEPFDLVLDLRIALRKLGREFPTDEKSLNAQIDAAVALLSALGVKVNLPGAAHRESTR